jgi:hypothetical protein
MGFPTSCRSASYATYALHYLVNYEALCGTVTLAFDTSFAIRVKPKLLVHPQKSEDRGDKLQSILVDVKLFRCNPPKPVKLHILMRDPQMVKPKTKRRISCAASTSLAYAPRSSHAFDALSADGLLFSSPGTRICDQRHRESFPAFGSSTKPTSNLRYPVES